MADRFETGDFKCGDLEGKNVEVDTKPLDYLNFVPEQVHSAGIRPGDLNAMIKHANTVFMRENLPEKTRIVGMISVIAVQALRALMFATEGGELKLSVSRGTQLNTDVEDLN